MQEQPPSDPPRREPPAKARRSRSPRPTFSPPPTPEPPSTDAGDETNATPPRRRTRGAAPSVLFQPPTPADDPPAPRPRPAAEPATTGPGPSAGEPAAPETPASGTPATDPATTDLPTAPGTADPTPASDVPVRTPEPAEGAPDDTPPVTATPVGGAAPKRARRAPAEKAAKKTAPTARKAPATSRKTTVAPEFTAPDRTDQSPSGAPDTAVDAAGAAPRPVRARRGTKTAPAAKTSPTKRATTPAPAEHQPTAPEPAEHQPTTSEPIEPQPTASEPTPSERPERGRSDHEPAGRHLSGTEVAGAPDAAGPRTPVAGWQAVGPRLRDHPGFAPELLALAAVDALGPRARSWVEQVRSAYPAADADGVARLATRRFVRMAGTGGALAAGAGVFAPAAELAAVLWTQANLVLHVAAAYGRDPAHPDRAAELLVLTSVHPDDGAARAALAAARAVDVPADGPWGRTAEAAWRLATPVAAQAGGWLGLRLAARLLPGAAVLAAAIGGTAAAERVAARAVARYRRAGQSQSNQDLGSSA